MIWEDAIEKAKENLGLSGYTNNWNAVTEEARRIISEHRTKTIKPDNFLKKEMKDGTQC